MEEHSDRRSVSSKSGLGRSNSFSTFYMPSKRMGEYVPVHYRRVSSDKYDLAYDRYYTESQSLSAAELLNSLNRNCQTKAKAQVELEEKENIQMSKLPDYFAKKRESLEIRKVEKEKVIDQKKIGLRYTGGYTDVSNWESSKAGKDLKMKRWDSLGVLGLVCKLYSEREGTRQEGDKLYSEREGPRQEGGDTSSACQKTETDRPACRYIKIEVEGDVSNDDSEENQSEEEEFLTEDENEYFWD